MKPAVLSFVWLTVLTGIFYPLLVTGIAQVFFKNQANGSLLFREGKLIGSELIGQPFDDPKYLWGRYSATSPMPYNGAASSGSNYGPMNPDFLKAVEGRVKTLKEADPANTLRVPVDLVTASASGLDPQISLAGAYYQVSRIARLRGLSEETVKNILAKNIQDRFVGILGEPAINVLKTNLDLDDFSSGRLKEADITIKKEPAFFNWKQI